jgi:hypothetical protein
MIEAVNFAYYFRHVVLCVEALSRNCSANSDGMKRMVCRANLIFLTDYIYM